MRALIFLLVTVIAGISLISLGIKTRNLNARFDSDGVMRVQGVVTALDGDSKNLESTARQITAPRTVTFHYEASDGPHELTNTVSTETWTSVQASQKVPIKYLAGNPVECRIDLPGVDASYRTEVWISLVGGFVLLALGCIVYGKFHRAINK